MFNIDGQIDYLVSELQARFAGLNASLQSSSISVTDASDNVVYLYGDGPVARSRVRREFLSSRRC